MINCWRLNQIQTHNQNVLKKRKKELDLEPKSEPEIELTRFRLITRVRTMHTDLEPLQKPAPEPQSKTEPELEPKSVSHLDLNPKLQQWM